MSGLARQSVANAFAAGSILLSGAVSTVIVARMLGPASLGVVTYAAWLTSMVLMVADLGMPGALARYLPEMRQVGDRAAGDGLTTHLYRRYIAAVGVAALAVAGVALWQFAEHGRAGLRIEPDGYKADPVFWLLVAAAIVSQSSTAFSIGLLRGQQAFGRMARIMLAASAVQIATTVVGSAFLGITGALAAAVLVGCAPSVFLLREVRGGSRVAPDLRGRVARYCGLTWAAYLLSAITWARTEILFLERSWGSEAVALFSVGLTLANLAVQAPLLLTGTLLPFLARHIVAGQHERAVEAYQTGMRYLALLAFPACFGVAAIAPVFVPLVYGPGFAGAVAPAALLIAASAFSALTAVTHIFMNAAERNRFNIWIGGLGALAVVTAGLTLIPAYGLMGAAAARATVQILVTAVSIWYVHRHLRAPAPLGQIARIIAAAALCGGSAYAVLHAVPRPSALAPAILAGMVTYAVALRLLGCITPRDADRLRGLIDALPMPLAGLMAGAVRFYR